MLELLETLTKQIDARINLTDLTKNLNVHEYKVNRSSINPT